MSNLLDSLAWLPPPPPDFTTICRGVPASPQDFGQCLQWLASHALDEIQLNQLAKQVARAREAGHSLAPLTPFKLGLISNATTDLICPALVATALRHGIALECVQAPFGQVAQQALSSGSEIKRARPDAVLVAADFRGLPLRPTPGDETAARESVTHVLDHLTAVREGIKQEGKAICILQTIARPAEPYFGSLDLVTPGTLRHLIDAVNRGIAASIAGTEDVLLDVAGLAETVGLAEWHSPIEWNLAKLPFASTFLPLYADHVCRLIGALRGKSRRCLVLDLDNTLWSGVIGDDGIEGIIIGQGDAKRAVAIALRNRWRRLQLDEKLREEVMPKNILMIGPTGVGKTEISRRLAKLAGAPFLKVEATKFTEVGYVGRDVDSIVRDLI